MTYVQFLHGCLVMASNFSMGTRANRPYGEMWRIGQTVFNVLASTRPSLSEQIRGTDLDAFTFEERVPLMLGWIEEHWNDDER